MTAQLQAAIPPHVASQRIVDFDIYHLPSMLDPHAAWKTLQEPGMPDIVWTPRNGGHWILTRARLIEEGFADFEKFSSRLKLVPKEVGEQYRFVPSTVDPPEHRPYRRLLNSSLSSQAIKRLEPEISALAERLIERFRAQGQCNFTTDYAQQLPIQIFLAMCALPPEDGPPLKALADQITRPDGSMTVHEAVQRLTDYLAGPIAQRIESPGDDVLSRIATGEIDGERLTLQQALAVAPQVLIAGLDTVVNFLSFAMLFLARHPQHRQQLIEQPQLIAAAADELLRRFPLVVATRVVAHDVTVAGVEMKEGDMVVLPSPLFGLDERQNTDPLAVDFARANGQHCTFGRGPHHCPGSFLARAEVRITIATWLRKIPEFAVASGADIAYRGGVVPTILQLPLVWNVSH
ncbi:MAG: cytochrome P450 [Steroidobacteraceae bacterium]